MFFFPFRAFTLVVSSLVVSLYHSDIKLVTLDGLPILSSHKLPPVSLSYHSIFLFSTWYFFYKLVFFLFIFLSVDCLFSPRPPLQPIAKKPASVSCSRIEIQRQSLGRIKKNSFIDLPGKGGHSRLMP